AFLLPADYHLTNKPLSSLILYSTSILNPQLRPAGLGSMALILAFKLPFKRFCLLFIFRYIEITKLSDFRLIVFSNATGNGSRSL
ncbi:hypothetical protein SNR37_004058, partial [Agarivorans aestuarii]